MRKNEKPKPLSNLEQQQKAAACYLLLAATTNTRWR